MHEMWDPAGIQDYRCIVYKQLVNLLDSWTFWTNSNSSSLPAAM